jgi:hypothetical protein
VPVLVITRKPPLASADGDDIAPSVSGGQPADRAARSAQETKRY